MPVSSALSGLSVVSDNRLAQPLPALWDFVAVARCCVVESNRPSDGRRDMLRALLWRARPCSAES
jgi:hypothetical protein